MVRFGNPVAFYLFAAVLITALSFLWSGSQNRKRRRLLGQAERISTRIQKSVAALWLGALCFVVIALARPQGNPIKSLERQNVIDLVFVIDVSDSMLASDIRPSRIERARREVQDVLSKLRGERVGLVIFSGAAFVQTPLTHDYATFRTFLELVDPAFSAVSGSNLELALARSLEVFGVDPQSELVSSPDLLSPNSEPLRTNGAILVLTDGEVFEGDHRSMAERVSSLGIRIYGLGIGTESGSPIPDSSNARGLRYDNDGSLVITRLEMESLLSVSNASGGIALKSTADSSDVDRILEAIRGTLTAADGSGREVLRYAEFFQFPLGIAIGFILLAVLLSASSNRRVGFILFLLTFHSSAVPVVADPSAIADAERAFREGRFEEAHTIYQNLLEASNPARAPSVDLLRGFAATLYRQGRFGEALKAFEQARAVSSEPTERAELLFNEGNTLTQLRRYQEAIQRYEESLRSDPKLEAARQNRDYVQKLIKQESDQNKSGSQSDQQQRASSSSESSSKGGESQTSKQRSESSAGDSSAQSEETQIEPESKSNADREDQEQKSETEPRDDNLTEDQSAANQESSQKESNEEGSAQDNVADIAPGSEEFGGHDKREDVQEADLLLNSVRESYDGLRKYRKSVAEAEMRRNRRQRPVKDW